MQAFIVRPFGTKSGINFDKVQAQLIDPALKAAEINGGTTGLILEAGNIRADMFQLLLLADLVIADVSIHNANVFYELGIRHALRPRQTYLIRAAATKPREERGPQDEIPFDITTDRYLEYNHKKPAASVETLLQGLKQTKTGNTVDSPVFRSLPRLKEPDHIQLNPVPLEFANDADSAAEKEEAGKLGLLAYEAGWFLWQTGALRLVGRRQFELRLMGPARQTWEKLRTVYPDDLEANLKLGTIYQKLGRSFVSDQRLQQALECPTIGREEKAEALALQGSNVKVRARQIETQSDVAKRRIAMVLSRSLEKAASLYRQAYEQDLNHYYSGLNALALTALLVDLITAEPATWSQIFDTDQEADQRRKELASDHDQLVASVGMSLKAALHQLKSGAEDRWLAISQADFKFLTATRDTAVVAAYEGALAGARPFYVSAARSQVEMFGELGVRTERVQACLASFPRAPKPPAPLVQAIVFTGHMIDAPGRETPRFPATQEETARRAIHKAVADRIGATPPGYCLGIAGGANGGDILFHEICAALGIETRVLLTMPETEFIAESVAHGGPDWVRRFEALIKRAPVQTLGDSKDLPRWMRDRAGYDVWQRTNLWLIEEALSTGAPVRTLIALWDGKSGDGPGGTKHLVELAKEWGLSTEILSTSVLFSEPPSLHPL